MTSNCHSSQKEPGLMSESRSRVEHVQEDSSISWVRNQKSSYQRQKVSHQENREANNEGVSKWMKHVKIYKTP